MNKKREKFTLLFVSTFDQPRGTAQDIDALGQTSHEQPDVSA
jgi:hypothetical protein